MEGEGKRVYPAWPTVCVMNPNLERNSILCIYIGPEHGSAKRCDMHGLLLLCLLLQSGQSDGLAFGSSIVREWVKQAGTQG